MAERNLGVITAYGYALKGGYTGTEEEFAKMMAGGLGQHILDGVTVTTATGPSGSSLPFTLNFTKSEEDVYAQYQQIVKTGATPYITAIIGDETRTCEIVDYQFIEGNVSALVIIANKRLVDFSGFEYMFLAGTSTERLNVVTKTIAFA